MRQLLQDLLRTKPIDQVHDEEVHSDHVGSLTGLKRNLSALDLTAFGIAALIGAGIFSTIGTAAHAGGPGVIFLFIITAVVCGLSTACYAEFASKVPAAGSAYTYAYVTLGELFAWIIGWDLIMEYAIGNIAVAISWSGYFVGLLDGYGIHIPRYLTQDYFSASRAYSQVSELLAQGLHLPDALKQVGAAAADGYSAFSTAPRIGGLAMVLNLPAFAITVLVTGVVYVGIKESKWASNIMVALKIAIILLVIIVGAYYVQPDNWIPFVPNGMTGVMKGVSAVFFAYIGFDAISTMAEECHDPKRDLPRGMFWALLICTILYSAIALVITGVVSYKTLNVSDPLAFIFGPHGVNVAWVSAVVSMSAVVAMASVLLVFQVGQPRIWMAMSRDGLLPRIFAAVHPRFQTPWFSTLLTGVLVGVPALFMNLVEVTDLTSIGTLFAFILVSAGVIRMHEQRKSGELKEDSKAFNLPIISSRIWFPAICLVAFLAWDFFATKDFHEFFSFEGGWHGFRDHVPRIGYLIGVIYLNYLCVRKNLSLIPVLALASCGYLMAELGWVNWVRFIMWLGVGLSIYFVYSRRNSNLYRQSRQTR